MQLHGSPCTNINLNVMHSRSLIAIYYHYFHSFITVEICLLPMSHRHIPDCNQLNIVSYKLSFWAQLHPEIIYSLNRPTLSEPRHVMLSHICLRIARLFHHSLCTTARQLLGAEPKRAVEQSSGLELPSAEILYCGEIPQFRNELPVPYDSGSFQSVKCSN